MNLYGIAAIYKFAIRPRTGITNQPRQGISHVRKHT